MTLLTQKRYLIFIRHAQQDRTEPQPDCGLTKTGYSQAQDVARFVVERWPNQIFKVLSSPKRRCLETMKALEALTHCKIQIDPLLHEAVAAESYQQFYGRIEGFLNNWKTGTAEITIACTHSDWIPGAVRMLTGKDCEVRHTGLIELCHNSDNPQDIEITLRRQPEIFSI